MRSNRGGSASNSDLCHMMVDSGNYQGSRQQRTNLGPYNFRSASSSRLSNNKSGLSLVDGNQCNANNQIQNNRSFFHQRKWVHDAIDRHFAKKRSNAPGSQITVATYNILSQNLLERHPELYVGCSEEDLKWNNRRRLIFNEIDKYQPDILCLQEVHHNHYASSIYNDLVQRGYKGVYIKRPGEDNEDGCATFFRSQIFELAEFKNIDYQMYDSDCECRSNVGQILVLRNLTARNNSNSFLCIANTHLLYNPNRGDIKLSQAVILLAELDKFTSKYQVSFGNSLVKCPVIFCGDFNLLPQSDLYLFLCRGMLQIDGLYSHEISGLKKFNYTSNLLEDCQCLPSQISNRCKFMTKRNTHKNNICNPQNIISHDLNLTSAYPHVVKIWDKMNHESMNYTLENEISSSHLNEEPKNLDYILYSVLDKKCAFINGKLETVIKQTGPLQLISWLQAPTASDHIGPIPNSVNGSDHIMLVAKFLYKS